jgi:hypothetical protein
MLMITELLREYREQARERISPDKAVGITGFTRNVQAGLGCGAHGPESPGNPAIGAMLHLRYLAKTDSIHTGNASCTSCAELPRRRVAGTYRVPGYCWRQAGVASWAGGRVPR